MDLYLLEAGEDLHRLTCSTGNVQHLARTIGHQELDLVPCIPLAPGLEYLRHPRVPIQPKILLASIPTRCGVPAPHPQLEHLKPSTDALKVAAHPSPPRPGRPVK